MDRPTAMKIPVLVVDSGSFSASSSNGVLASPLEERPGARLLMRSAHEVTAEEANLRVHIASLRTALGGGCRDARYIVNITGRGNCFLTPVIRLTKDFAPPLAEIAVTDLPQKVPARPARIVACSETVLALSARALSAQLLAWRFASSIGPSGIGKTTVALSIAYGLLDTFAEAIFFVDLAALTDARLVPMAVASALELVEQTQDPVVSSLDFISGPKTRPVLHNCECVIDGVVGLAERLVSGASQARGSTMSLEVLLRSPDKRIARTSAQSLIVLSV